MKSTVASVLLLTSSASAWTTSRVANSRVRTALDGTCGIYFSTSTGNCETVAGYIGKASGVEIGDIADAKDGEVLGHDALIVGAPTWMTGMDERRSGTDFDDWLYDTLPNLDLSGKKVAVFGVGDQQSYGDFYCDAAGELYDMFKAKGCTIYGFTSTEGYVHQESKAEIEEGKFCGCLFDEDNQDDLSEDRASNWVAQLKEEGFF